MDAITAPTPVKINRWLPWWAVVQSDVRYTLRSWVYRTWIILSFVSAMGFLLYRLGAWQVAGVMQSASEMMSDLLHWTLIGSVTLIISLTVGSIASERGTMADSVLSRGISRYQYFLGKWHSRLITILLSFLLMSVIWVTASYFLLPENLSLAGVIWGLLAVLALLTAIVSCGVSISAMTNSTVLGMTLLWLTLYGISFVMSFLPAHILSPEKLIERLPYVLEGNYDVRSLMQLIIWSLGISGVMAAIGMSCFARRDV